MEMSSQSNTAKYKEVNLSGKFSNKASDVLSQRREQSIVEEPKIIENSTRDKPQPTLIERKHQELSSLLPVQVSEPKSAMHSDLKSL